MKTNRKAKFSTLEKIIYTTAMTMLFAFPFGLVNYQGQMNDLNIQAQNLTNQVNVQTRVNESIQMKISELASLENIEEPARVAGLQINNDNIKSIQ